MTISFRQHGVIARLPVIGRRLPDILHFESGTINFTVNSIYEDGEGCICLESNEIMELDDYPVGQLLEDLSHYLIFGVRIPKACV